MPTLNMCRLAVASGDVRDLRNVELAIAMDTYEAIKTQDAALAVAYAQAAYNAALRAKGRH